MLRSVPDVPARSSVCPMVVGRAEAIETLRGVIDGAATGVGRAALLAGDAGIGKSRLLATVKPYAAARGFRIVKGACFPQDRAEPYAPLADALRTRFAGAQPEEVAAICGPYLPDLLPLLPELAPLAGEALSATPPDRERRRLFAALAHCLGVDSGSQPVLLAIEDLHWCDEASLDFLFSLSRRAQQQPFMLLGTYRADETTPHLRAWLAQMERAGVVEEVSLTPLSGAEVTEMVRALVGPGAPLDGAALDALIALAEGNPFAVEELVTSIVAGAEPTDDGCGQKIGRAPDLRLPRSLHAAVQSRVERLSLAARDVLQLAAVIGRRFDCDLLLHLTGRDQDELLSLLEELVDARLIAEESSERFAFRHALTRQAVYTELLARVRARLHRRVAEAAEYVYATSPEQHLGDLADHFGRAEVWDKAQAYALRAGERALRLSAARAATEHFTRAIAASERLARAGHASEQSAAPSSQSPQFEEPSRSASSTRTAAAAQRGRARAFSLLGDFDRARDDCETAIDLARSVGDVRQVCQGLVDAGVLWASRDYALAGRHFRRAVGLARGIDEPALLAEALNRLGNWYANTPQPWEAVPLHTEALAIAERAGCEGGTATTLDWLGTTAYLSGDLAGSIASFERAAPLFRALDDKPVLASCLTMLSVRGGSYVLPSPEADADDVAAGLRDGEEALALARAIDAPGAEAFALIQLAVTLGPRGEYGRALELARRALEVAEAIGHGQWLTGAQCALGALHLDLLAPEEARRHLEQGLSWAKALGSTFWTQRATAALALAHLQLHEPDRAAAVLDELPHIVGPVRSLGHWWEMYARARLALVRRDPAQALRLCDSMRGTEHDRRPAETPLLIRLRADALVALAGSGAGGPALCTEVEGDLLAAREAMRRQGTRSELWRIHAALGDLYRACSRDEEARAEFAAARALIEQVSAAIPEADLRTVFLQRATALLPRAFRLSALSRVAARFGGLTAREREVAALIARGRSNGEVAEALVLGKRTIETHVANIFTKLGVDSRREVAAWATAQGLTTAGSIRAA